MKMRVLLFSLLVGAAFAQNCPDNAADALKENVRALTGAALGSAKANSVRIKKIKVEFESDEAVARTRMNAKNFFDAIHKCPPGKMEGVDPCMKTAEEWTAVKAMVATDGTYRTDSGIATTVAGHIDAEAYFKMLNAGKHWAEITGPIMVEGNHAAFHARYWGTWGEDAGEKWAESGSTKLTGAPLYGMHPTGKSWDLDVGMFLTFNTEGKVKDMYFQFSDKSAWDQVNLTDRFEVMKSNYMLSLGPDFLPRTDFNAMYEGAISVSTKFYLNVSKCQCVDPMARCASKYFTPLDCTDNGGTWELCNEADPSFHLGKCYPTDAEADAVPPTGEITAMNTVALCTGPNVWRPMWPKAVEKGCRTVADVNTYLAEDKPMNHFSRAGYDSDAYTSGHLYSFRVWDWKHEFGTWIRIYKNEAAWRAFEATDTPWTCMTKEGDTLTSTDMESKDCGTPEWNYIVGVFGAQGFFDMRGMDSIDGKRPDGDDFLAQPPVWGPIVVE